MLRNLCLAALGAALVACGGGGGGAGGDGTTTTTGSGAGGSTTGTTGSSGSTTNTTGSTTATGTGGSTTTTTGSGGSTTTTTGTGGSGTGGTGGTGTGGDVIGPGPFFLSYSSKGGPGIDSRPSVTATFSGPEIVSYVAGPTESPTRGTSVTSEAGMDAFVAWGRWNSGTTAGVLNANPGIMLSATEGFHLVLGNVMPFASIPASGTTDYTLLAATRPTIEDGSFPIGTLTGSMKVTFAGAGTHVGVALSVDMPGDATYPITSTGGTATPATSEVGVVGINFARLGGQIAVTSSGKACTGTTSCKVNFQGFMAGANAERIALAFVMSAGMAGTQVRGVAVFARQ